MNSRILIVDDEEDMIELLHYHLVRRGHRVLKAKGGIDGLRQARLSLPDLILLDLRLEDLDGLTVCEILRRQPSTRAVPVIMMTAVRGQIARLNGLAAGANDFVTKPIQIENLLQRIDAALESDQIRQRFRLAGES